jgi:hypothetical protein
MADPYLELAEQTLSMGNRAAWSLVSQWVRDHPNPRHGWGEVRDHIWRLRVKLKRVAKLADAARPPARH